MTAPTRLTVVYGRDSDTDTVWITGRNRAIAEAVRFESGQMLVVSYDDGWWIEDMAGPEVAA